MKNLILSLFLSIVSFFSYSQTSCACVWVDASGNLNCSFGNCGGANWNNCYNQVSTPNLWQTGACPNPPTTNCNPYMWNTGLNGSCWYQGAGCSGQAVCSYIISLPIELIEFKAIFENGVNVLTWKTASENNSSHFNLLHTLDGETYQLVAVLPSSMNSTSIINYEARHLDYPHKINYYLLEQVDLNGDVKQYGPISVDNRPNEERAVRTINVLGQDVNSEYKGVVIRVFADGTSEMIYR